MDDFVDDTLPPPEVKVTVHGHSHLRDACTRIRGIWMCFPGGSSYSGYGLRGFDRRVRVFSISDWGETISTYKLLDQSGEGDREDGTFASFSASAAQAAATSTPDLSQPLSDEDIEAGSMYDDDNVYDDGGIDPTKQGGESVTTPMDSTEMQQLENAIKEWAEEEGVPEGQVNEWAQEQGVAGGAPPRTEGIRIRQAGTESGRYILQDHIVLVGQEALE